MTHKIKHPFSVFAVSALLLAGCSSSFQSTDSSCSSGCAKPGASGTGPSTVTPPVDSWKGITMDGALGNSGRFAGMKVVSLDKTTKEIVVSLPMPASSYIDGMLINLPLTDLPGAHIDLEPINGGGSSLVLRIPIKYVAKGVDFLPPTKLPNGDPLPAVADGEAPSLAMRLNVEKNIQATIYANVSMVGVYVNTPSFNPMIDLSYPINSADNRILGYLSSVSAKYGKDGGFFISVRIPDDIARIIDDNL